jgi:hypothetical protein
MWQDGEFKLPPVVAFDAGQNVNLLVELRFKLIDVL